MFDIAAKFSIPGRVAIITGAGGLLGRKHAEVIAALKGIPILVDIKLDRATAVAESLYREYQCESLPVELDITDGDAVKAKMAEIHRHYHRIDILINNAAMTVESANLQTKENPYFSPLEDYPIDLWRKALDVNLTGAFLMTQQAAKYMMAQKSGTIVNIASDVGIISPDHRIYENENFNTPLSYSVSKTGIIGFTRYLATYLAKFNIRVNALSPAGVYTSQSDAFVAKLANLIPLGRMAKQDEYQGAIAFLVSEASSFMTGENLVVDGGRTVW